MKRGSEEMPGQGKSETGYLGDPVPPIVTGSTFANRTGFIPPLSETALNETKPRGGGKNAQICEHLEKPHFAGTTTGQQRA
jgi:hypothetical protein